MQLEKITEVLKHKYKSLYNSVPTSDAEICISLMAAMLSSFIFRLTICISYVFHLYYHVYNFVDFNKSSFQKKIYIKNTMLKFYS